MNERIVWLVLVALCVGVSSALAEEGETVVAPLKALILSGRNNHDWQTTTPCLKRVLEESGRFTADVTEEPASLDAAALEPYDVLIDNWTAFPEMTGRQWGSTAEAAVAGFVRGGKGMVSVHAATAGFLDWPDFLKLGICTWGEQSGHSARHVFNIEIVDAEHPITKGLHDFATARDELYHRLDLHPPADVIARTYSAKSVGGTGRYEPMVVTKAFGDGRCVYVAMGHDVEAMEGVGFRAVLPRSAEWAATGQVTLAPPADLPPTRIQAVVVTGGHGFDQEAFPKLFEGAPLNVEFAQQEDDSELFEDIADWPHDVIVLYNMGQRISETRRAHFRELLDNGVGLVVLHHAVAAYNKWPEYQKIIGTAYYLEDTTLDGATHPKSTYAHDVDFALHIEEPEHPVTRGVEDFTVHDETYNGMTYDAANKVLVTTDHATSERPIAWVRNYGPARVCVIQVGHGPHVFTDANYKKLVQQAIAWTARRNEK